MMNAGHFNKRITIQSNNGGVDADGYPIQGTTNVVSVWAMVKPLSAKDYFEAKATQSERTTRFIIRYRTGIEFDMTILYGQRKFEIVSIINDNEENKTLTIIGTEVVL
ncbi:phage head closure protein [Peribacillus frigoritolerans]|nr:phage head closure protein [Peribacillus frigoritolerans]